MAEVGSNFSILKELNHGLEFLLKSCDADGFWRDFHTLAGRSDEWVSAYVACMLVDVPLPKAQSAAVRVWKKLNRRLHWSCGWGYNAKVPQDADSTAWSLHLQKKLKIKYSLRGFLAQKFLRQHQKPNGGIATYFIPAPIRKFTNLSKTEQFVGWCNDHCCVTALAIPSLGNSKRKSLEYLRNVQQPDGNWIGYWWPDDEYTTLLAVESLFMYGNDKDKIRINNACKWVLRQLNSNDAIFSQTLQKFSPFVTACAAKILVLQPNDANYPFLLRMIRWLLDQQNSDGSWMSSSCLHIPPPNVKSPVKCNNMSSLDGGYVYLDDSRIYSTATIVSLLSLWSLKCQ